MNRNEFLNIMAAIESNFETKAKTDMALDLWFEELKDIDYMICQNAVRSMYRNHDSRFVTVRDIRESCEELLNPKANIVEAYQLMTDTIRLYGRYQHQKAMEQLEAKNTEMHKVVRAIGYQQLCNCNLDFTRGAIERMYKAVVVQKDSANLLGNFQSEINEVRQIALKGMGD